MNLLLRHLNEVSAKVIGDIVARTHDESIECTYIPLIDDHRHSSE